MDSKDRERLMLSTGIALVGYAVIFLALMGLKWPPLAPFRTISPPESVYVNLQGSVLSDLTAAKQVPQQVQPALPKTAAQAPTAAKPAATSSQNATATPNPTRATQSASASGAQAASPAPVASQATAVPSRPNIPTSITSSAGPSGAASAAGSAPQSGGAASGPPSATAGVNYPTGTQFTAPPQGGGTGTQQNQGKSQTYHGTSGSSSGTFFNPELAKTAGTAGTAAGAQASSPPSQAQGAATAGSAASTSGTGAAGSGTTGGSSSGPQASSSGGPQISWTNVSAARRVAYEPKPLVIPRQFLDEIPPSITLRISFEVTPAGTVNALNVTPSLGYPQLDNLLEQWMEEWRFVPVPPGTQVAQGTLPYVIQATTAR